MIFSASLLACLSILLAAPPLARAQHWAGSVNPGSPPRSGVAEAQLPRQPDAFAPMMPVDNSRLIQAEACEGWTAVEVNSPTVSVARLAVPGNARSEFRKACGELKIDRFQDAESHARRAVQMYPDYAAAWVVLGQALESEHKDAEAVQACNRAMKADPTYAPPYICLAQLAEGSNQWDDVYELSDRARALDPVADPYAYYYAGVADLHLKQLTQAELDARNALTLDPRNEIPEIHLLLADIYQARGNKTGQAFELEKFLEIAPHDSQWQAARATLAAIQSAASK